MRGFICFCQSPAIYSYNTDLACHFANHVCYIGWHICYILADLSAMYIVVIQGFMAMRGAFCHIVI